MLIQDLVTPFAEFAAADPGADLVSRWHAQVVEPYAGLYRAIEPWLDPADAPRSLPALVGRRAELPSRARRAGDAVRAAGELLRGALPDAGRVDTVLLVGMGAANGWVTRVNGEPTLFLAVDQLPEPGFDVVLALHEMIHAEHQRRAAYDWPGSRFDADLFREGLAVSATTRLLPEIDGSGHLWFAAGRQGWIGRCRAAETALRRRALADLTREDVSDLWFSGAADRDGELPGRCGYWLGGDLVGRLTAGVPLETAMRWPLADVSHRLRRVLERPG
ncbi:hypothetical protein [Actinoplanes sp. NPDC026623]|uniref:hypothetical protein n=1 Tax=Actinoplanes sp. NPDC026623 TaxID=3155610 RepID=UPI0033C41E26